LQDIENNQILRFVDLPSPCNSLKIPIKTESARSKRLVNKVIRRETQERDNHSLPNVATEIGPGKGDLARRRAEKVVSIMANIIAIGRTQRNEQLIFNLVW